MKRKFLITYFLFISLQLYGNADLLERAKENYRNGIEAKTWQERFASLNEALQLYTQIEEVSGPTLELNHAIGDIFFELTDYPWAILYYERVLSETPQDKTMRGQLNLAQNKLGLESTLSQQPSYFSLVLLEPYLSQPFKLHLFFWTALLTIILGSLAIWKPYFLIKACFIGAAILNLLILLNYLLIFYFSPIEGVVVSATGLYREPNQQQPQLVPQPISAGMKVRVIETANQGFWLKIIDADGQLGYAPSSTIRII